MAFEHKDGTFLLFKNNKGDNEQRPDYRGEGKDLDGNLIEIAAWIKEGNKGKFMSCKFQLKKEEQPPAPKPQAPKKNGGNFDDMDDDIPF